MMEQVQANPRDFHESARSAAECMWWLVMDRRRRCEVAAERLSQAEDEIETLTEHIATLAAAEERYREALRECVDAMDDLLGGTDPDEWDDSSPTAVMARAVKALEDNDG